MSRVLLVIDDEPEFGSMMQRALRRHFDDIHVALDSAQAIALLENEPVTHVVCDLYLGDGQPLGHELLRGWRERKPSIRYMALFSGSSIATPVVGEGLDGVFKKPSGLRGLFDALKNPSS